MRRLFSSCGKHGLPSGCGVRAFVVVASLVVEQGFRARAVSGLKHTCSIVVACESTGSITVARGFGGPRHA